MLKMNIYVVLAHAKLTGMILGCCTLDSEDNVGKAGIQKAVL